ncbi:hypothetical protein IKG60_01415 [Candidatus Saccharibacteria bacterium]|nr:hypothetical protein [Candidatus Saccharibacteria bacterium]
MTVKEWILRYKNDGMFRNKVNLYSGAVTNLGFVGVQLYGGIRYQSVWFTSLAVYYALLSAVKFYIGLSTNRKGKKAWRTFQTTGVVMLFLNLVLITMVSMMIANPKLALHEYSAILAIVTAFWAVGAAGMAIYGVVSVYKKRNPVALADRLVGLITAAVSVLMLQTSLVASVNGNEIEKGREYIEQFGAVARVPAEMTEILSETTQELATSNTVTGVLVVVFAGGVTWYMIIRGAIEEKNCGKKK